MFVCCWLCVSLLFPYSLENHAQLKGGSAAERLRSTLAYGWVERCSDVAGCGRSFHKISDLAHFTSATLLFVNCYDMNMLVWMNVSSAVYDKQWHICIFYFNAFYFSISACYFMNSYVHGALSPGGLSHGDHVLFTGRRRGDVTHFRESAQGWYNPTATSLLPLLGKFFPNNTKLVSKVFELYSRQRLNKHIII